MGDNKIPLMDVARQYNSLQKKIDEAVLAVLQSGHYIMNTSKTSQVFLFEQECQQYLQISYAVGVGNGTDALVIALKSAGVKAGDEVITPAMSFFATAEAVASIGAVPVFVDCKEETFTIDESKIEEKITQKTKAIIPVHLYGQCAEMDTILAIAKKYKLVVIEDAAQAFGASYKGKKAGTIGDIGCFSFFPTKNLGGIGDGGLLVTNEEQYAVAAQAYRVHGSGERGARFYHKLKKRTEQDLKQYTKYDNFIIGYNSRLDEIQAAVLRVKLPYIDEWNQQRGRYAKQYNEQIKNTAVKLPIQTKGNHHIYYTYVIMTEKRNELMDYLKKHHITTGIYFPVPLHLQKAFESLGYQKGDMPVAEMIAEHSLAIPMFPELTKEELEDVIHWINQF